MTYAGVDVSGSNLEKYRCLLSGPHDQLAPTSANGRSGIGPTIYPSKTAEDTTEGAHHHEPCVKTAIWKLARVPGVDCTGFRQVGAILLARRRLLLVICHRIRA